MLHAENCKRYTLVIEWSRDAWRQQLAEAGAGHDSALGPLLCDLEALTWSCDRVHVAVTAALTAAERAALAQVMAWWGCETVEVRYLDDERLDQALRFMPYISRIAKTATGMM